MLRIAAASPAIQSAKLKGSTMLEARGVWLYPESMFAADPLKGKEQIRATIGRLADARFNLVLPWIGSGYLVALDDEKYRRDHLTARWDAIGVLIEEAHGAGLDSHIWYSFTSYRSPSSPDLDPRVGGDPNWAARHIKEFRSDSNTGRPEPLKMEDVCPQHPGLRRWQRELLTRMLRRYPLLRGLHIEEPGYNYAGYCLCDLCLEVFPKIYGEPLPECLDSSGAEDFRTIGTSAFTEEIAGVVRSRTPPLTFSTNGGYNWREDRRIGRDWGRWARSGLLDYYAAQIYVNQIEVFRTRLATTIRALSPDCPVYAGLGFQWSGGRNTVTEIVRQIEAVRESGASGLILFYGGAFTTELYQALATGPFRWPAKLPMIQRG